MGQLSIRVNLTILKQFDIELLEKVPDYGEFLRIVGWVQFKKLKGWTEPSQAIIDTGAYTSLFPISLWQDFEVKIISDHYVRGLVPKKQCKIDVRIGWISCKVIDKEGNITPEIKFRAFLALVDNIPLILGLKDLLDKFKLIIDPIEKSGYIEF